MILHRISFHRIYNMQHMTFEKGDLNGLNHRVLFVLLPAVHGARQEEVIDHRLTDREWAEEWKHLDNVCISVVAIINYN